MHFRLKKFYGLLLAGAMTFTTAFTGYTPAITSAAVESSYTETATAVDTQATEVAQVNSYGLANSVGEGVILHCWNWSFNAIKAEMANIAAAGYTAVQTSPVQRPKDGTAGNSQGSWWKVYQPTTLCFAPGGHVWFGTKDDFKAMCDEADKYGIKIIVDVVANHMANVSGDKGNCRDDISSQNDSTYYNDDSCWHLNGSRGINYGNVYRGDSQSSLTRGFGGWPDLNTANSKVQQGVLGLLKECIDLGADGFRFDAAKHIELPEDPAGSDFWPNVINGANSYASSKGVTLYNYGEILDDAGTAISNYTKYMGVTDNRAGNEIRYGVQGHNAGKAGNSAINYSGESSKNIVLWAESHDTYANDGFSGPSVSCSQHDINKTWAIVASRNFPALYYIRPGNTGAAMGTASSNTNWKNKEVAEVNKFHNFYSGKSEYMGYEGSIVYDVRNKDGVVLVNVGGDSTSVNFSIAKTGMKDGEYKDQVSGNTFRVSSGTISGNIGSTGIAVVYNAVKEPAASASVADGAKFTDSLDVTISLSNATSGTYKIDNGSAKTFTSSKTITLGANTAAGSSVKLTLTATDGSKTTTATYTYYKKAVGETYTAWFKKPSGWGSTIYCYAYDDSVEPTVKNAKWPGVQMTKDSETGYYKYEIPSEIESPKVIFNDNNNQTPGANKPGLEFTSQSMLYKDGEWKEYNAPSTKGTVIVKYVDGNGTEIASSTTLTGTVGSSYTTSAKEITGYTLKTTPSNATGKYTSSTITVTYVYNKAVSGPSVTSSLASGSTFKTETTTITLTLSNATSGTYKIDNGITKSFTGSTTVKIGEGKIADSDVTVEVTATKGSTTNKQTFTYTKEFNGTVNETTTNAAAVVDTDVATATLSNSKLDSQYKTKVTTKSKTISVDGDISDWSSDMLIAQGAANDDPRVYRPNSMYEVPIDLYALYATYDNSNLYLMWEMTNVQDVVAPNDNYPLTQGFLYNGFTLPIFIAIDTRDSATRIGNDCKTAKGGTLWDKPITYKQNVNKIVATFTDGSKNFIYGGDSTGVNPVELCSTKNSGIVMKWGKGILSKAVMGINGAYGSNNGRAVGDMTKGATYVDFNKKGHNSASMDFHYEMSIPLEKLGTTYSQILSNGLGVELIATMGNSGMDCLPYDVTMNDNADKPDTKSQPNNSFEKSDDDVINVPMGSLVKSAGGQVVGDELELNFGADRSAPQAAGTTLSLLGKASGGSGTYTKYQYYVNGSLIATKTSQTAVAWTPSAAGKYVIKCVVTDSQGKTVTSSKYFTVEGGSEVVVTTPIPTLTAGDGKITATWSAVEGATNYRVFTELNGGYTTAGYTTSTSYTISGLTNGTKYGVLVLAYGNGAWSKWSVSDIRYVTPAASSTTPIPTLTAGDGQIKVTWSAVNGASNYRIFTALNGTYTTEGFTTGTKFTISGLKNGTKYGVLVLACVNGTWSRWSVSDIRYVTPVASGENKGLTLTAGAGKITATWGAVSGASNYRVFTCLNGNYTTVGYTTTTSFTITGLKSGTSYGVLVLSYVNGAWSEWSVSDIRYATPVSHDTVPGVTLESANGKITANWTALNGASNYRIFTCSNGVYTTVGFTTGTEFEISGLTNGTSYGILVLACVNGTWSKWSVSDIRYATAK